MLIAPPSLRDSPVCNKSFTSSFVTIGSILGCSFSNSAFVFSSSAVNFLLNVL